MSIQNPLAEPGRIAVAGDWHGNLSWSVAAVEHAAEAGADVIVHLGDFGYEFRATFITGLDRALRSAGLPLLFVDGNHECFPVLDRYPIRPSGLRQVSDTIWHLPRGFRWTWAGLRFLACGGAHSVDRPWRVPGASWWAGEWITDADVQRCAAGGPADVLISHDCPTGVDIPGLRPDLFPPLEILRADEHRAVLRRVVDATRPGMIWHGHYHQRYTWTGDLGYGPVTVRGLDCDATTMAANVRVVDVADLRSEVGAVS